ncbi:MAG: aspartate/tyrosine/aromatic aminotransferase [Ottowia sp.]|nr:aspartate/tyrosine/aromatic aminotransferase [Ottowia sp.]
MDLFATTTMAPRDPILGLNESFNADTRVNKVNLGVGVYFTEEGRIPLLRAVRAAEKIRLEAASPRGYLPIDGIASYAQAVQTLLLGKNTQLLSAGRMVTVQTLGGTGALKIGADFLKYTLPNAHVAISDPSWENHRALFETAGFTVHNYRYYDAANHGLDFAQMRVSIKALPTQSIIVLHACCHNPTGVDLNTTQWQQVIDTIKAREHIPFLDMAYQGFAEGLEPDSIAVQLLAQSGLSFLVSSSFSKSFSLYGERVGALSIVTQNADQSSHVLSQIKRIIRTNYSNPPTHGATVVSTVLNDPALYAVWEEELNEMRKRIQYMRQQLVDQLAARGVAKNFDFVKQQRGMFSYSGLTEEQVNALRNQYAIYAVSTGRICVAALNQHNIAHVVDAIAQVLND